MGDNNDAATTLQEVFDGQYGSGGTIIAGYSALEAQIRVTVDRMKVVSSETALKYMEEDIMSAENQIKELDSQLANNSQNAVDIELVLQYAKYLLKHLSELLLDLSSPLRKAAFFGVIFNSMPSYTDLDFETQEKSPLPGVNGLFRIAAAIQSTSGGTSWSRFLLNYGALRLVMYRYSIQRKVLIFNR